MLKTNRLYPWQLDWRMRKGDIISSRGKQAESGLEANDLHIFVARCCKQTV